MKKSIKEVHFSRDLKRSKSAIKKTHKSIKTDKILMDIFNLDKLVKKMK